MTDMNIETVTNPTTEALQQNIVIPTEGISNEIIPKRGRGRPKKVKTPLENSNETVKPKRAYRKKNKENNNEKSEQTSDQKSEQTSDEKSEQTFVQKSEQTSYQKSEQTSDQKSEHTSLPIPIIQNSNNKKSLPAKYEKFLLFGVHLIKHILDSDIPFNSDNILSLSLFNSDIDSQIAFVDNFLSQIKNTKSFIYNLSNNNDNNHKIHDNYNPFVDSLVKLANLHSHDNEHIHCQVFEFNNQKFLIDQLFNVRPLHDSNSIIGKFDIHSLNVNWL